MQNFHALADAIVLANRKQHLLRMVKLDQMLQDAQPKYVKNLIVDGELYQSIDDGQPNSECFASPGRRIIPIPDYIDLQTTKALAITELKRIIDERDCDEPYSGLFVPTNIALLDQFGQVVTTYRNSLWTDEGDLPDPSTWDELLAQAAHSRTEATSEAGMDNYSTACLLRQAACVIEEKVKTAKNIRKLIR